MAKSTKELKTHQYNPRKISRKQYSKLEETMRELGDISGVVHNLTDNQLIGGNQRSKVFNIDECEIVIEHQYNKPTRTGTVAIGYILFEGERFAYRQVRWEEKKAHLAMVIANKAGGEFDFDILANLPHVEIEELKDIGFTDFELGLEQEDTPQENTAGTSKKLSVEVFFDDEQEANDFFEEMGNSNYKCKLNR